MQRAYHFAGFVVSLGFHTETAATYLPQLEAALRRIHDDAQRNRIPLESVTSEATAASR